MPRKPVDQAARLERQLGRIMDAVEASPGLTGAMLCRRVQPMRTRERLFATKLLIDDGYLRCDVAATCGRPRTTYWPTAAAKPRRKEPPAYEPKVAELARQRFKQTFLPFVDQ